MRLDAATAAVGSMNPAKLEAVRLALARLAPACRIEPVAVTSRVATQPVGDDETRRGALERARAARDAIRADLGFGLEGGVHFAGDEVWLISWVAAVDGRGRTGFASGLRMPLPPRLGRRLRDGAELGDLIDELFGVRESKRESGAIGLLTGGSVSRSEAFADLVAMACVPLLRPDLYD